MPSQRRITGLCEVAFLEEFMKAVPSAIGLKVPVMPISETEKSKQVRSKQPAKQR